MVYRGKPSAGCENCRKAKKRCGLEQPACSRCVKLKKTCSGYRDTTQLQIQDESESVKIKAKRRKARTPHSEVAELVHASSTIRNDMAEFGVPEATVTTPHSDWAKEIIVLPPSNGNGNEFIDFNTLTSDDLEDMDLSLHPGVGMPFALKPQVDDVATAFFFDQFTAFNGHWSYLREQAARCKIDPMVAVAIKACGMAALDNVQGTVMGRHYARSLYADALGQLNAALRDPKLCKTNECLIAVSLLAYFENLSCDCHQSIQSWKAHINGATQLLKLRGRGQFKTLQGRTLFRETRASILIHCIWDDLEPPAFLLEWDAELNRLTPDRAVIKPAEDMTFICFEFAALRSQMCRNLISDAEAAEQATKIEMKMVNWSISAMSHDGEAWKYYDLEVPDSPDVWNGVVHAFSGHPVPSVWNSYRSMRILLSRTQEMLLHKFEIPEDQKEAQMAYYRSVRRQMTDDICAGIPTQLGHAAPAYNSPCVLITAYASIWPLFFACTCVLERIGLAAWQAAIAGSSPLATSAAASQAFWIIGRMDYISRKIGLRWAEGVAATLKGDFRRQSDLGLNKGGGQPWIPNGDTKRLLEQHGLMRFATRQQKSLANHQPVLGKSGSEVEKAFARREELTTAKRNGWPITGAVKATL